MNETTVCVVGNVATRPVFRETAAGTSARFRLAVTQRYWDREKNAWRDGHTNFFTVWANRTLATNVQASVSVGEPLVVRGRLKIRSEQRDGQAWSGADIEASAIGHDLARGTAAFRRALRSEQTPDRTADQDSGQGAARQGPGPVSDHAAGHAAGHVAGSSPDPAVRPEPDWETGPTEQREPVLAG